MTSAIDELKALLGASGEPYVENGGDVTWRYYSDPHTATEAMDGTLIVTGLTPARAIAATLGGGTCIPAWSNGTFYCDCGAVLSEDSRYCHSCGKRILWGELDGPSRQEVDS